MLDVHPPHKAAESWREFIVHIATIVIGLLIAIGLEQTVEHFHHRDQVAESREALRRERNSNRDLLTKQVIYFRRETAGLQNNLYVLLYLQKHPGTPQGKLPGILTWHSAMTEFSQAAWLTAQQSGITALMRYSEVENYAALYRQLHLIDQSTAAYWAALVQALRYSTQDPDPSHLSPAALAEEIELTKEVLVRHHKHGVDMSDLTENYPDFAPGIQSDDLETILHADDFNPALAGPLALTIKRIDAAGKAIDYCP